MVVGVSRQEKELKVICRILGIEEYTQEIRHLSMVGHF